MHFGTIVGLGHGLETIVWLHKLLQKLKVTNEIVKQCLLGNAVGKEFV